MILEVESEVIIKVAVRIETKINEKVVNGKQKRKLILKMNGWMVTVNKIKTKEFEIIVTVNRWSKGN